MLAALNKSQLCSSSSYRCKLIANAWLKNKEKLKMQIVLSNRDASKSKQELNKSSEMPSCVSKMSSRKDSKMMLSVKD